MRKFFSLFILGCILFGANLFADTVVNPYTGELDIRGSGSGGSGDVTAVGDCASGACYDGTSDGGTYARLYDGDSNYTQLQSGDVSSDITITLPTATGTLIANVVEDTSPQLGGNLDVNTNKLVSTSNGNIDIEPNGTGNVLLGNFTFDTDQTVGAGQDNYVLTYDNTGGLISLEASAGGGGGDEIIDADADTYVQVEDSADEDFVRVKAGAATTEVIFSNVASTATYMTMGETTPSVTNFTLAAFSGNRLDFNHADKIVTKIGGSEKFDIDDLAVIVNELGQDVDFEVEGDGNAVVFKVDAGLDEAQFTGPVKFTALTVATLGTPSAGSIAVISDGASATDCTTGSGSTYNLCIYNGSAWVDA